MVQQRYFVEEAVGDGGCLGFSGTVEPPIGAIVEECGTECTTYKRIVCVVAATNCSDANNDTQRNECISNIVSFRPSVCLPVRPCVMFSVVSVNMLGVVPYDYCV